MLRSQELMPGDRSIDRNAEYAETRADDLVVNCIRELVRRHPELPPERIDEVAIAATTQIGDEQVGLINAHYDHEVRHALY